MLSISLHLDVGAGWQIVSTSIRMGSAIALVVFQGAAKRSAQARLDVGKRVFLDPLPVDVPNSAVADVIEAIGRQQREEFLRSGSSPSLYPHR
jgi:hypothetical protein